MRLVPAGFPPICSLYLRDSRQYLVNEGGIPADIQQHRREFRQHAVHTAAAGMQSIAVETAMRILCRRESRRYVFYIGGIPADMYLICILYRRDSRRYAFCIGGNPADTQSICEGIPPIRSLYWRESRMCAVYIGG